MIIEGERFHDVKLFLSDSGALHCSVHAGCVYGWRVVS